MILVFKYVFRKSGKVSYLYQSIDNDNTRFKLMLPTRWTVRCKAISAVLHNSLDIINALETYIYISLNIAFYIGESNLIRTL